MYMKSKILLCLVLFSTFLSEKVGAEVLNFNEHRYYVTELDYGSPLYDDTVEKFQNVAAEYLTGQSKILNCKKIYDLPVGTASGNHSYGGICTVQNNKVKRMVMVCVDEMVGHRSLKLGGSMFEEDLKKFIALNCYGG